MARVLRDPAVTARRCFGAVHLIGINEKLQEIFRLTLSKALQHERACMRTERSSGELPDIRPRSVPLQLQSLCPWTWG